MPALEDKFTVEFGQRCPDCGGVVYADEDGYEAQCSECFVVFDIKEQEEKPKKETEPEPVQDFTDDEDEIDLDELERDLTADDPDMNHIDDLVDDDEVLDASFEVTSDQPPILDVVREQLEADYNDILAKVEADVSKQLESIMPTLVERLSGEVISKIVTKVLAELAEQRDKEVKMENIYYQGTRPAAIMATLLSGPKTIDEIREVLPPNRGKAPTDKTIKSWVMDLDQLRDYRVTENEAEKTFRLERR